MGEGISKWIAHEIASQFREVAGFHLAFHDRDEIGPKMLARIAKHTGLKPEDL